MTIEQIITYVKSMGNVLTQRPRPGDGTPEVAWGDVFFYYAPDGVVPKGQPFATIVTKDYPGEPSSGLRPGVFRVNVDAGRRGQPECDDPTIHGQVLPHPVYGRQGWVCIVQPGLQSLDEVHTLLRDAHSDAQRRWSKHRQ